jgi:hypothetical protein
MRGYLLRVSCLLATQLTHSKEHMPLTFGLAKIKANGSQLRGLKYYHLLMKKK